MGTAKKRDCLKCGKKFDSEWSGNRICTLCSRKKNYKDVKLYGGDEQCAGSRTRMRSL